ncbi:hypothetical protein CDAR_403031 [Caerostris darwini]|uniref:Uncharacterized protein n=1 Tax=Caerostris darwini TaxID=1538125 RepID=A0AAV4X2G2_9ARAC|nr:hypothetical protein CDAR_403031 [Caerostris darwini]
MLRSLKAGNQACCANIFQVLNSFENKRMGFRQRRGIVTGDERAAERSPPLLPHPGGPLFGSRGPTTNDHPNPIYYFITSH